MDLSRSREQWIEHLGDEVHFPRDVAFPWRRKCCTEEEFLESVEERLYSHSVYTSVYSDVSVYRRRIDKIFLDFDRTPRRPSLEDVWRDVRKFSTHMEDCYDLSPRIYFSGGGFSVYLDIEEEHVDNLKSVKWWVGNVQDDLNIISDSSVLGDWRRISRLPFTFNHKYGKVRMVLPVTESLPITEIVSGSENGEEFISVERRLGKIPQEIGELDEWISETLNTARRREIEFESDRGEIKDELDKLMGLTKDIRSWSERNRPAPESEFDGRHRILHFLIVPRLLLLNSSEGDIHDYCRDFVEKSGRSYADYMDYVDKSMERTLEGSSDSQIWLPWSFDRFILENKDLRWLFRR